MSEEFEYLEEYRHPYSACLNLTDSCNLFCVYCFVQQQPNFMTFQVAKDGVDWLAANLNWWREYTHDPQFKGSITYFGGEPTLMWDEIIVPLTAYIKETYPDYFDLTITTNGTLLNEERIKFLYDNQIYPLLSIDGIKEVQDYNRPMRDGSSGFDKLIEIIPTLLYYFPYTTFRMTLIPDTLDKFFESYCWAEDNHFKNIYFCPNSRIKWKKEELNTFREQLDLIMARRFVNYSNGLQSIGSSQIDDAFRDVLDNDAYRYLNYFPDRKDRTLKRCGLGTGSCSIGYNGDIYGCQEQDSRTKNIFYLGNIYKNGIEKDKHTFLLQSYSSQDLMKTNEENIDCEVCFLKYSCYQANCPSSAYDTFNSFFTRNYVNCVLQQTLYTHAITFMNIFVEQDNQTFKKYLDDVYKEYKEKEEEDNE